MKMNRQRKPFTIEIQRGLAQTPPSDEPRANAGQAAPGIGEVLRRLDDLAGMIQPGQAMVANIAEAYRREVEEVLKLRDEMESIQQAIRETKRHVVSFHAASSQNVAVNHAAGELGAVVMDTEGATNNILAAAERIEMLAGVIQSEKTKDSMKERAGEIASIVMSIYEACNFQDLTGQRITRVCETLSFVEERVNRMTDIWGGLDSLSQIMAQEMETIASEREALGTHALAAGPAMVGADGHVGQDDIDALFE
ncbi:MAG: protein phosphatase CheZ [Beijerinckiaceae bacterium]